MSSFSCHYQQWNATSARSNARRGRRTPVRTESYVGSDNDRRGNASRENGYYISLLPTQHW
uniref:Uncharacterized protein n=1 Tax=Mycobacterium riyadhense TaxID=486698 RepID=A0A653ET93_9MYCO|nr:hypothetical protein BIN_B_03277 [Mycobacterium riyadhense]